ncbi:MAG TPA: hypothetical protein PKA27_12080 [Fimbriimonadaceae bacterium]|nr:hypothetical protein [Fimbriimonadaceae bacterium]
MRGLTLLLTLWSGHAIAQIDYTLRVDLPAKSVRVSVRLETSESVQEVRIPAWCPGFYFIQKYQGKMFDVTATDANGARLTVRKKDDRGWIVENPEKGAIRFNYRVLGDDGGLGFFNVSVRNHAAFVNGPAGFVYFPNRMTEPHRLTVELPPNWQVATSMPSAGSNRYESSDYDEFIDHPIQLGQFERRRFMVGETPFEAVFVTMGGRVNTNIEAEVQRLEALSKPAIDFFRQVPFSRYLYIIHLDPGSFDGGLEHRASCVINTANSEPLMIDELLAHEFFHAWNVKQIRPKVLGPFDYTQPVRTANLWFAEGVTDYYAYITTYRSGLQSEEWLLENLVFKIAELQNSRVRLQKTLEEVCKGTWETGGFGDGDLSYYTKGLIAGFVFDANIRHASQGKKSLDDVMRLLFSKHRLPKPGFDEDNLRAVMSEVAGTDLSGLYDTMIRTTKEVPYEGLSRIGLRLVSPGAQFASLGFKQREGFVTEVGPELTRAGLRERDRITMLNGVTLDANNRFDTLKLGDEFEITVARRTEKHSFKGKVKMETAQGFRLERDPFAPLEAQYRLRQWLERPSPMSRQ